MICIDILIVSGQTPEEPVVSTRSGQIYEKRLIEKYVEANGKEPGTSEILELKDLLPVKGENNNLGIKYVGVGSTNYTRG